MIHSLAIPGSFEFYPRARSDCLNNRVHKLVYEWISQKGALPRLYRDQSEAADLRGHVPVQLLLPLARKQLRDLFHILIPTTGQALDNLISIHITADSKQYTHNDNVLIFGQSLCQTDTFPNSMGRFQCCPTNRSGQHTSKEDATYQE